MSEAHWYVVHTYSGYENKVKVDIEKTIENRNLQDQILEVSVPMLPVVELKNGVEKKADKKMFPGYVLINMVMNDDTWYVVRNTRGVTGFVGPGCKPDQGGWLQSRCCLKSSYSCICTGMYLRSGGHGTDHDCKPRLWRTVLYCEDG